jgi:HEAT repeat protein
MASGWTVRWASVRALGVVGAGDSDALPALVAALDDEMWQVRGVAALALGQFGRTISPAAVAAVTAKLEDDNESVRNAAESAIDALAGN